MSALVALCARSSPASVDSRIDGGAPAVASDACTGHYYCLTLTVAAGGAVTAASLYQTIVCPPTCQLGYDPQICVTDVPSIKACGYNLTLTESPATGYAFVGWGGDCTSAGSSGTCTLPAIKSYNVSASFVRYPNLTVQVTGPGTVTTTGMTCTSTCSQSYPPGTQLTLTQSALGEAAFDGWGAACASSVRATTCSLTLNADATVSAAFSSLPQLSVERTGGGAGTVTSNPAGIDCGSTCSASFAAGTVLTLTATAGQGSRFAGWGGACSGVGTCTLTVNSNTTASVDFELNPVLGDAAEPPGKPLYPPPAAALAVSVAGNGSVVTTDAGRKAQSWLGLRVSTIQCGLDGFSCYATATPGADVTLRAKPGFGAVFKRWRGACASAGATCRVSLSASRTVTAVFAPRTGEALAATLTQPRLHIRWRRSVGRGTLVVSGRLTKPALLRIQLRRPHGGPLLTESTTVPAGRFTHVTRLFPGVLAGGARLFPGGIIVVVTGRSGSLPLPFLLQTVVIASPPEGVVRRSFVSDALADPPVRSLPTGSTEAWAHFVFQEQPRRNQRVTVRWYWPNGRVLGTALKANRPSLVSFIRSDAPLPRGAWRAELRAGRRVVTQLVVRIK